MRRFVSPRLLIVAFFLLALEFVFIPFFDVLKGRLAFLSLLILDYAFSSHDERLPFFAMFVGFIRDFAGGHLFGIETFSFTLTGLLLYLTLLKLDRENYSIRLGLTFLFVLLTEFIKLAFGASVEISNGFSWNFAAGMFLTALYTTACAPGFFWIADRWFKRTSIFRQYELF